MAGRERTKKEMEARQVSDQSFKIWDPKGKLVAHMSEGEWIKKPKYLEKGK